MEHDPPWPREPYDEPAGHDFLPEDTWPADPAEVAAGPAPTAPAVRRRRRTRSHVRELVETGILAVLVFLLVRSAAGTYAVEGHSMDPTLADGEFLVVSRLQYAHFNLGKLGAWIPGVGDGEHWLLGKPGRGDVVVLKDPRDPAGKDLVKRIVGLPNETVEIVDGHVYIDGKLLAEPYITAAWSGSRPRVTLGQAEYFLLGDNRNNSSDSRVFGVVPEDLLEGRVIGSPWPPAHLGIDFGGSPKLSAEETRP
jgi:signal peptidase I